jgi:hypothetical protein
MHTYTHAQIYIRSYFEEVVRGEPSSTQSNSDGRWQRNYVLMESLTNGTRDLLITLEMLVKSCGNFAGKMRIWEEYFECVASARSPTVAHTSNVAASNASGECDAVLIEAFDQFLTVGLPPHACPIFDQCEEDVAFRGNAGTDMCRESKSSDDHHNGDESQARIYTRDYDEFNRVLFGAMKFGGSALEKAAEECWLGGRYSDNRLVIVMCVCMSE